MGYDCSLGDKRLFVVLYLQHYISVVEVQYYMPEVVGHCYVAVGKRAPELQHYLLVGNFEQVYGDYFAVGTPVGCTMALGERGYFVADNWELDGHAYLLVGIAEHSGIHWPELAVYLPVNHLVLDRQFVDLPGLSASLVLFHPTDR